MLGSYGNRMLSSRLWRASKQIFLSLSLDDVQSISVVELWHDHLCLSSRCWSLDDVLFPAGGVRKHVGVVLCAMDKLKLGSDRFQCLGNNPFWHWLLIPLPPSSLTCPAVRGARCLFLIVLCILKVVVYVAIEALKGDFGFDWQVLFICWSGGCSDEHHCWDAVAHSSHPWVISRRVAERHLTDIREKEFLLDTVSKQLRLFDNAVNAVVDKWDRPTSPWDPLTGSAAHSHRLWVSGQCFLTCRHGEQKHICLRILLRQYPWVCIRTRSWMDGGGGFHYPALNLGRPLFVQHVWLCMTCAYQRSSRYTRCLWSTGVVPQFMFTNCFQMPNFNGVLPTMIGFRETRRFASLGSKRGIQFTALLVGVSSYRCLWHELLLNLHQLKM